MAVIATAPARRYNGKEEHLKGDNTMSCTTILVGKSASNDRSTMIARTDDGQFDVKKLIVVNPERQPRKYKSVISHLEIELPDNPMRYTACPSVDKAKGIWAATGINAANVGMTATETITSNPRVLAADPLVEYREAKGRARAIPGGIGEEDIVVLETAMILREVLMAQGATVVLTRDVQDVFHTNIERCEIAEAAGAHVMLRLHCNNSSNQNKTGIQIYSPLNSDYARAVASPEEYRLMGETLMNCMKDAVGYERKDATGTTRLNDSYVGNNWAKMACFLVEMGYMSNPGEDIKLATPEYQRMLAEGMAEGVYQIALIRGWVENEATE
jgi:hypothetical protein